MGDLGLIPGLGRSPGKGKGNPFQYSGLENSMDHGIAESDTTERLSLPCTKQCSKCFDVLIHLDLNLIELYSFSHFTDKETES